MIEFHFWHDRYEIENDRKDTIGMLWGQGNAARFYRRSVEVSAICVFICRSGLPSAGFEGAF